MESKSHMWLSLGKTSLVEVREMLFCLRINKHCVVKETDKIFPDCSISLTLIT